MIYVNSVFKIHFKKSSYKEEQKVCQPKKVTVVFKAKNNASLFNT